MDVFFIILGYLFLGIFAIVCLAMVGQQAEEEEDDDY